MLEKFKDESNLETSPCGGRCPKDGRGLEKGAVSVGLYFGSFNPVHLGHFQLAEYLTDNSLVDEVWLVVSPCNPLKKQTDLLDEHIRLQMVELSIAHNPRLKVSDVEFDLPVPSYTVDTLRFLSFNYPQHDFSLLIGSDNALLFDRWRDFRVILENYRVFVYPRRGYDFNSVAHIYPQMQLLSTPYYDISSSEIRHSIAQKKDVSQWLHPDVLKFTKEKELYIQ